MKRGMKNKAQMQISFGMIFSIILIIVFLAFAFFGIIKFVDIQNNVLINKFVDNLNNDIDKMWKSSRGSQEVTYDLPKKIKEVCFKDYEKENVYFISDKNFEGGILNHVNFDETLSNKKELCIATQDKKITFVLDKFYEESLVTISKDGRNKVSNENSGNLVGGVGKVNTDCEGNPGEFLIINEIYDYTDSLHGFKFWDIDDVENSPESWTSPYDYFNGEIYTRFEVISQPTDRTSKPQFGIWQLNEQGKCKREIMSKQAVLNGEGSIATIHSSPNTWWDASTSSNHDSDAPVDFSKPNRFCRLGTPFWSDNSRLVSDWLDKNDWDLREEYFPMRIKTTVVAVPAGGEFSGWDCWMSGGYSNEGKMNLDLQSLTFAVIGDSMSNDIVVPATRGDWPGYLITKLGLSKSNFQLKAHSGDTCSQVYNQLVNQVADGTDFLFSTCGINGFTENTNNIQWYQKIYNAAKEKGISKIYMTTMPPSNTINEQTAAQAYCDNMKEQNIWLKNFDQEHEDLEVVDLWSMWHDSSGTGKTDCGWRTDVVFNADRVHPNAKGSEAWAEEYYKIIEKEIVENNKGTNNVGDVDLSEATIIYKNDLENQHSGKYNSLSDFLNDWATSSGGNRWKDLEIVSGISGNAGQVLQVEYPFYDSDDFYWICWSDDRCVDSKGDRIKFSSKPSFGNSEFINGGGPASGGTQWKINIPGNNKEIYLSYKIKFKEGFYPVDGGKLPGLCGGHCPGGGGNTDKDGDGTSDGFSARLMFEKASKGDSISLRFYVYHPDRSLSTGDSVIFSKGVNDGEWHNIVQHAVMNDLNTKNGVLEAWLDGELVARRTDFNFRQGSSSNFNIDYVYFSTFFGGDRERRCTDSQVSSGAYQCRKYSDGTNYYFYTPRKDEFIYFDDLVIFNYN